MDREDYKVASADIVPHIHVVRGHRVLVDNSLAQLYGVPTKALNQAVARNQQRFPADFMFQLIDSEWISLRSQFVTLKKGRGEHRKFLPYAFTEHGGNHGGNSLKQPARSPDERSCGQGFCISPTGLVFKRSDYPQAGCARTIRRRSR